MIRTHKPLAKPPIRTTDRSDRELAIFHSTGRSSSSHSGIVRRALALGLCLILAVLIAPQLAAKKKPKPEDQLPEPYRTWLQKVELIISKDEKQLFLELAKDYQRDAFIERFWKARDPYPETTRNEFRDSYEARLETIRLEFGGHYDDRARILLLNGPPLQRLEISCAPHMWPTEVWYYEGSEMVNFEFLLLFYQRWGNQTFKLWEPFDGVADLGRDSRLTTRTIANSCGRSAEALLAAISFMLSQGGEFGATTMLARINQPPETPAKEWINTFSTYSTDLPADSATFNARFEVDYPGRFQSRTVVQGSLLVHTSELAVTTVGEISSYNLLVNGEVLREGKLLENFRYKFDLPTAEVNGENLPLIFQRNLRPGSYQLIVKAEDLGSGKLYRREELIEVPKIEAGPPPPQDPETARILAEANAAIRSGENTVKIAPLLGEWQTGMVRIDTLMTGNEFAEVTFFLDDQPILTKKRPPFNVELDLGPVPRGRVLRVEGYDEAGTEIANDEMMINAGTHRFAVRLVEPKRGKTYRNSLRAQAEVLLPEGDSIERLEIYLNETLIATLYQPPYVQPIVLSETEPLAYVRAVAFAPDGNSTEDLVFINAPDNLEEIDVDFVELYTTVLDRDKRPVEDLSQADFTVLEDGVEQEVLRFEQVRNLPIHVAIMLDVSASMEEELENAQTAALSFFQQAVTPKDRATFITFNDHPNLVTKFTNDLQGLSGGLAGLKAERGTALYDSLIFTLYYFNGIKGQRAILLLSDGKDESSRFEFDDALEYCRRAGVSIYAVGLKIPKKDLEARRKLNKLADETGGRTFFVEDSQELTAIYDAIQLELRSRYLLAYQSSNRGNDKRFRSIEVRMTRAGSEAKTLRGYYP